jgi:hypothetical protein
LERNVVFGGDRSEQCQGCHVGWLNVMLLVNRLK